MATLKHWIRIAFVFVIGLCLAFSFYTGDSIKAVAQSPVEVAQVPHNWSFHFDDYRVEHQRMSNLVNVTLDYTLKNSLSSFDGSSFTPVFNRITGFLDAYPNEDDYWEVVARNLTQTLLHEHPEWSSTTLTLSVQPSSAIPFTRASIVTLNDDSQMVERWRFSSEDSPINYREREQINIAAEYTYRSGLDDRGYPNFVPMYRQLIQQFSSQAEINESWEMINHNLAALVLAEQPSLTHITLTLSAQPTARRPYPYLTQVSLERQENS